MRAEAAARTKPLDRSAPPRGRDTLYRLSTIEARRLSRSPTLLIGAALTLLAMVTTSWSTAAVLNRDDATASGASLLLAGATLMAVNIAALRSRRHATEELLESMPSSTHVRTLVHLVSAVPAVALATLLMLTFILWRLSLNPVTTPDPLELLTGPTLVALGAAMGVALARWTPSMAAAPLTVLGVAILEFSVNLLTGASSTEVVPNGSLRSSVNKACRTNSWFDLQAGTWCTSSPSRCSSDAQRCCAVAWIGTCSRSPPAPP